MRLALCVLGLVVSALWAPARGEAAPDPEVVLVWAPHGRAVLGAALDNARARGATVLDSSPSIEAKEADAEALRAGQAAYADLRFDEAVAALSRAAASLEVTGGRGLTQHQLADVFLMRALAQVQLGAAAAAWDDFIRAAVLAPTRVLDPAQLPPRAVEQFERARIHAGALPRLRVTLAREPACAVTIDGTAVAAAEVALPRGWHYLVALCPARQPIQRSFELAAELALDARGAALPPPSDESTLIQLRSLGARAGVVVTTSPEALELRRVSADGRLTGRTTVPLGARDAAAAIDRELLRLSRPAAPPASPWYRSRWAWAAAGVVAATAVLLPLVLADDEAPSVVIRPEGAPW